MCNYRCLQPTDLHIKHRMDAIITLYATLYEHGMCHGNVRLSVCTSVILVDCVETDERINIFSSPRNPRNTSFLVVNTLAKFLGTLLQRER